MTSEYVPPVVGADASVDPVAPIVVTPVLVAFKIFWSRSPVYPPVALIVTLPAERTVGEAEPDMG
jgi:hypothetical protein